jgi:hypothetical protein
MSLLRSLLVRGYGDGNEQRWPERYAIAVQRLCLHGAFEVVAVELRRIAGRTVPNCRVCACGHQ